MWNWISKPVEKQLARCAIRRVKTLPDGTECSRIELLFPKSQKAIELVLNYPFRAFKYMLVNKRRLLHYFWNYLLKEGYIEDESQTVGTFGGALNFVYRNKEKLMRRFSEKKSNNYPRTIYLLTM